jgi:micrococcal nuclease
MAHGSSEGESLAVEATEYNRELVEGKMVRLEFGERRKDKYGRILAYVYVNNTMVNIELLKEGLARAVSYPPNLSHQDKFESFQREAKEKGIGIWGVRRGLP